MTLGILKKLKLTDEERQVPIIWWWKVVIKINVA